MDERNLIEKLRGIESAGRVESALWVSSGNVKSSWLVLNSGFAGEVDSTQTVRMGPRRFVSFMHHEDPCK
jgi:hypothetical protein